MFWLLLLALPLGLAVLVLPPAWRAVEAALRPEVIAWVATHLSDEERRAIRAQVASPDAGLFEPVPDPVTGRLLRPDWKTTYKQAEVLTNNAGQRSRLPYTPKPDGVFRILCLGDSFVFGAAGAEADRFCDQIQAFYQAQGITVAGRRIETVAVGLPSWSTRQETAYLTARLDAYAPDVVLLLTVQNDITDSAGVTGNGDLTSEFSTDQRALGSGAFFDTAAQVFGLSTFTALSTGVGPTSRAYWAEAFAGIRQLVALQQARGGHILLSVMDHPGKHKALFLERYKTAVREAGAPWTVTRYWHGPKTRLPHDGHPNRLGHALLAQSYIHTLAALGWVPVPAGQLQAPEDMQPVNLDPPADEAQRAAAEATYVADHLGESLDFTQLDERRAAALLGGIFPEQVGRLVPGEAPWASVRAGFLLRLPPQPGEARLQLVLGLPAAPQAYPLPLTVKVNGRVVGTPVYEQAAAGTTVTADLPVPAGALAGEVAAEILLETPRHVGGLADHRMKSYRLVSAGWR